MAGTKIFVENIEIYFSTPLVLSMEAYTQKNIEIMVKGTFVQNMLV